MNGGDACGPQRVDHRQRDGDTCRLGDDRQPLETREQPAEGAGPEVLPGDPHHDRQHDRSRDERRGPPPRR